MNIHFGKLPDNRGRHPLSWAFLMNEFEIWASLHLMNGDIDKGCLLCQYSIIRSLDDGLVEVEEKLIAKLPAYISIALDRLNKNVWIDLPDGVYRESLRGKLDELEPSECMSVYLINAIRSQRIYGGIKINGKKITSAYVYKEEYADSAYDIVETKDFVKLMVR